MENEDEKFERFEDFPDLKIAKKNGGTIKFKILDRWMKCSRCEEFFKKHYYVHQCLPYKIFCNDCLIAKRKCKNCNSSFVKLLKI